MPSDDRSFHREQRLRAIARWSEVGIEERRVSLPIERAYRERIERSGRSIFRPVKLGDIDSVDVHRQVSYLVDALDCLPGRVDIAFDSVWKAFEVSSSALWSGNITERLRKAAEDVRLHGIVDLLLASIPSQSCEYLFKRLVLDYGAATNQWTHQPNRRLRDLRDPELDKFLLDLQERYGRGTGDDFRRGAMLLRLALQGATVVLGDGPLLLGARARACLLLGGLMYTSRNDRFHGDSFSPFVSSAATIRTYTHPHYLFLSAYALLLASWCAQLPQDFVPTESAVRQCVEDNLTSARAIFGRHWLG